MMNEVTKERTHWRDEKISLRHRLWGVDCKMTDIDFLTLEYHSEGDLVKPVAVIEYKKKTPPQYLNHNTLQHKALRKLSSLADLPFLVVFYQETFKEFGVFAGNKWAMVNLGGLNRNMTEKEYVTFLYKLRNLEVPPYVWQNIRDAGQYQPSLFR